MTYKEALEASKWNSAGVNKVLEGLGKEKGESNG
tara:strand:- start:256 stop:357 length:102 start_codon:yes stop_codon:yes gene_type:complete